MCNANDSIISKVEELMDLRKLAEELNEQMDAITDNYSYDEIVKGIHQWYIDYLTEKGLDGQAIYDKCMSIVEANKAAHTGDWDKEFNYADWTYTPDTYK